MWPGGTLDQCSIRAVTTAPATPIQALWDFMMARAGVRVSMAGVAFVTESREMTWSETEMAGAGVPENRNARSVSKWNKSGTSGVGTAAKGESLQRRAP